MEVVSRFPNNRCDPDNLTNITLQTFNHFKQDMKRTLGDSLFEIIIFGSYVLDDFQPGRGDIDYIVVTNEDLNSTTICKLYELHDKYRQDEKLLLHQLEGTFYPKHFLKKLLLPFTGCYIGTGRTGWSTTSSFQNSFMDLRLIKEHGIHLLGKDVEIYAPFEAEIIQELIADVDAFISSAGEVRSGAIGMWVSSIHLCARTLFYLSNDRIASKTEACRWCANRFELETFLSAFRYAENRRHPYENSPVADCLTITCTQLLEYVQNLLHFILRK